MAESDYDPTEWIRDLRRTVGDKLMADIVNDFRNYNPAPRSLTPPATVQVVGAGRVVDGSDAPVASTGTGGWVEAPKVDAWRPPGVDICDQLMDQADAIDRAERVRKLAQTAAIRKAEADLKAREEELNKKQKGPKR